MISALLLLAAAPALQEAPADDGDARAAALALAIPELGAADLDRWREHVRPTEEERGFEELDWIPDLAGGLRAAEARGRPLLLWLMNGHPLACT